MVVVVAELVVLDVVQVDTFGDETRALGHLETVFLVPVGETVYLAPFETLGCFRQDIVTEDHYMIPEECITCALSKLWCLQRFGLESIHCIWFDH